MYEETVEQLYSLWKIAVQERDEAREKLEHSLTELFELKKIFNTILSIEEQNQEANLFHHLYNNNYFSEIDSTLQFSFVSNSIRDDSEPEISDCDSYGNEKRRYDYESVVMENLGVKKDLPENGKLLKAVMEAGEVFDSLLVTSPVPKWRNPPVLTHFSGKWIFGGSGILNQSLSTRKSCFST